MSEAAVPADGTTAGTLLREAREAAGLHAATLAANLKVPLRKLEALEEDRYDLLGDAVFVRALASSICRTLKIDPQPVLQRLPQTASPRLVEDAQGINAPFRAPGDGPSPGVLDQVSRPVVLTVVALLLGALVLIFLPMAQRGYDAVTTAGNDNGVPPAASVPGAPATQAPAEPAPPAAVVPASDPAPATAPGVPSAAPAPLAPPAPAVVASAAPAPASPAASAASAPQAAASGPIDARGIVVFRTRAPSWIQVTDAAGATVLQRLMQPGESAGANGTLPLSVVVGSVEATEVQVRGQPYNLGPVSKDNVARFQVK
ncbi:helix-turn-helix domain-containing protein [Ramlibacter sp. USB13]|uniref:Helix-turn-helix domain-containing protein n=1 Tax=Ramlibacter cellulosilyticus TaxID=2764187 RepID=A0A923MRL6_9BURK|nr:RodZ domain-containing protein [Ramlibacter cellulosilyticus]MBC5783646.1 helix-turn-helix domain-containing protein [Ramlibacter cellulosilyticus]